jgi:hypothetical protein
VSPMSSTMQCWRSTQAARGVGGRLAPRVAADGDCSRAQNERHASAEVTCARVSRTDEAPVTPGSIICVSDRPAYDSLNAIHALFSRFRTCRLLSTSHSTLCIESGRSSEAASRRRTNPPSNFASGASRLSPTSSSNKSRIISRRGRSRPRCGDGRSAADPVPHPDGFRLALRKRPDAPVREVSRSIWNCWHPRPPVYPVSLPLLSTPETPFVRSQQLALIKCRSPRSESQSPEGARRQEATCFANALGRLRSLIATPVKSRGPVLVNHDVPHAQYAEPDAARLLLRSAGQTSHADP